MAGITIDINVGGALWMSLTIAAGNVPRRRSTTQLIRGKLEDQTEEFGCVQALR